MNFIIFGPFRFGNKHENKNNNNDQLAFNYISPVNALDNIASNDDNITVIDISKMLYNKNVYIRINSVDDINELNQVSDSHTFYDNQLIIQIKETYGQIKVLSKTDNKPIRKAYIKYSPKQDMVKMNFLKMDIQIFVVNLIMYRY